MTLVQISPQLPATRREWRAQRVEQVLACIAEIHDGWHPARLPADEPVRFAVLNQIFKVLLEFQREDDFDAAHTYLDGFRCSQTPCALACGMTLVCAAGSMHHADSRPYLSDCYLLQPDTPPESDTRRLELLAHASALIPADFLSLIAPMPGILVLLQNKPFAAGMNSYALSDIHGTIYLDVNESELRTAETVLHESSHCWLTELLMSHHVELDPHKTYYSPWKATQRPAFGMLHAIVIFAILRLFFVSAMRYGRLPARDREYCAVRGAMELENLRGCGEALRQICDEQIHDRAVSTLLLDIYRAATA